MNILDLATLKLWRVLNGIYARLKRGVDHFSRAIAVCSRFERVCVCVVAAECT